MPTDCLTHVIQAAGISGELVGGLNPRFSDVAGDSRLEAGKGNRFNGTYR